MWNLQNFSPQYRSTRRKMHGISIVSALAVAYVHRVLRYGEYAWPSFSQFFGSWLLHYFAVLIVAGIFLTVSRYTYEFFFGSESSETEISIDKAVIYCSLFLLIISVLIFLLAHLELDDDYWGY